VGYTPLGVDPGLWLASITLPAVALAIGAIATVATQTRGSMIDVLQQDYVRTLRSRGLPTRSVLLKHALRNAAPASLTVLSLQFIALIGGAVVIEKVFGLTGIGQRATGAASQGDVPLVLGIVVVTVVLVVLVNLLVDVLLGWLNPKVRIA
jgi:peptide/nickel transport system permease protein